MRIRSKWRTSGKAATPEDNATALAYVLWQIALTAAKNLHEEEFDYQSDQQRVDIIGEYIAFLTHVSDRLVYEKMDDELRSNFITQLAKESAKQLHRNAAEILGPGDYSNHFINLVNDSSEEYSNTMATDEIPSHDLIRCFGHRIFSITGNERINHWVLDHTTDIEVPKAIDHLKKAMKELFETSNM